MKFLIALLVCVLSLCAVVSADPVTGTWLPIDITGEELSFSVSSASYSTSAGVTCIEASFTIPTNTSNEDAIIGGAPLSLASVFWPLTVGYSQAGQAFTAVISSGPTTSGIGLYKVNGDALKYSALSGKVVILGGCYPSRA